MQTIINGVKVEITATRSDEDPWRLERIEKLLKKISERVCGNIWLMKIYSVHDHKGTITFLWRRDLPGKNMRDDLQDYWYNVEGEITFIEHNVI